MDKLTVKQLRFLAHGISGSSRMKKADLIKILQEKTFVVNDMLEDMRRLRDSDEEVPDVATEDFPDLSISVSIDNGVIKAKGDRMILMRMFPMAIYENKSFILKNSRRTKSAIEIFRRYSASGKRLISLLDDGDASHGILGIDIPFKWPDWIPDQVKIGGTWIKLKILKPGSQPVLTREGIRFFRCGEQLWNIHRGSDILNAIFPTVYPRTLYIDVKDPREWMYKEWEIFRDNDEYRVSVVAMRGHALVLYKTTRSEYLLFDSSGRRFVLTEDYQRWIDQFNITVTTVAAPKDQFREGSCVLHAFAKAAMIGKYGGEAIQIRIQPWAAMLVASFVSV